MDVTSPCGKAKSQSSSGSSVSALDDNIGNLSPTQEHRELNASESNTFDLGEGLKDLKLNEDKPGQKGLSKFMTFPSSSKILSSVACSDGVENGQLETEKHLMISDESMQTPFSRSMSLPAPLKLVSAMKGGRERQGASPRKLTVKWAPDVYDPPPSIVSHTVNRGKKQQKGKKDDKRNRQSKRKKGQKGNSSRSGGGGCKDKKQYPKTAPISMDKCYKSLDACDRVEFDVTSPDLYCGSSFLKSSLTKVHYSVAEAS